MYTNMDRQSRNRETQTESGRLQAKREKQKNGNNAQRRGRGAKSAGESPQGKSSTRRTWQPRSRRRKGRSQKRGHAGDAPQQPGRGQDSRAKKNPHRHCCRRGTHRTTTGVHSYGLMMLARRRKRVNGRR